MGSGYRWLLQNYNQTWLDGTCQITFTTDVAVHVFMRYTDIPPRMHLTSMTKRGLALMKDPYYCFVAWAEIEQEEAGDTLSHTIIWPGWHDCLTQWFYFRGEIAGSPTPTQWGIFHKHYVAPLDHEMLVVANGDEISIPFPVDPSVHFQMCQLQDSTWYPPDPHYLFGHFEGNYVHVRIYNTWQWFTDLYQLPGLPPFVTDILKVTVYVLVGKVYVYGRCKTKIKTHGTVYEGAQISIGAPGLKEYFTEYSVNPFTGSQWTVAEVNALQAGLALAHAGTFGMALCDQVRVIVSYRPVV